MVLVEKVLDNPSLVFQLNPNIILDMLLESQCVLRSCIVVIEKYKPVAQQEGVDSIGKEQAFQSRFPRAGCTLLLKAMSMFEKNETTANNAYNGS